MRTIFTLVFFLCFCLSSQGQYIQGKYFVSFSDKNTSSPDPATFLSSKALLRRSQQNISITSSDFPVSKVYLDSLQKTGALIYRASKWLNGVVVDPQDSLHLEKIKDLGFVKAVDLVYPYQKFFLLKNKKQNSDTSAFLKTTDLNYGNSYSQVSMLKTHNLHNLGYKGAGKTIAVIDAGFSNVNSLRIFDSLRLKNQVQATYNFVNNNNYVYAYDFHGTEVLSTMASNLSGTIIGTAPGANYILLVSEDLSSETPLEEIYWACAAEFADSAGTDIISSSLGYNTFPDCDYLSHKYSELDGNKTFITRAADIAASKGILVVIAQGNEGTSSWKYLLAPADGDSVLSVGAVNSQKVKAAFSSVGPAADKRIKPDVAALGQAAVVGDPGKDGQTTINNGTSFACPLVAGSAACLWEASPSSSAYEVYTSIKESSSQFLSPDSLIGYGIPDFSKAYTILTGLNGIKEQNLQGIRMYPSPFKKEVTIEYISTSRNNKNLSFYIYDSLGRQQEFSVNKISEGKEIITLPEITPSGIFFVKLVDGEKIHNFKLIKAQ